MTARMSKEVQLHVDVHARAIVELSGAGMTGGIEIHTRRVASSTIDA